MPCAELNHLLVDESPVRRGSSPELNNLCMSTRGHGTLLLAQIRCAQTQGAHTGHREGIVPDGAPLSERNARVSFPQTIFNHIAILLARTTPELVFYASRSRRLAPMNRPRTARSCLYSSLVLESAARPYHGQEGANVCIYTLLSGGSGMPRSFVRPGLHVPGKSQLLQLTTRLSRQANQP